MSNAWKIGDVAFVECSDGDWRQAVCEMHANIAGRLVWRFPDRVYRHVDNSTARPAVVIDPEDRERVALLLSHYHSWKWTAEIAEAAVTDMQAALRSLVAEPEPEEPTGLGAVVRDGSGSDWVRIYQHDDCNDWRRTDDPPGTPEFEARSDWRELPRPLTVLSPGWEPEQ